MMIVSKPMSKAKLTTQDVFHNGNCPNGRNGLSALSTDRRFVMSFARGLAVMHVFGKNGQGLTALEVSR